MTNSFHSDELFLNNILHSATNYINSSNNTIEYLNNSIMYLNNSINHLNTNTNNSMLILLNNYYLYNNYSNNNSNSNSINNSNSNSNYSNSNSNSNSNYSNNNINSNNINNNSNNNNINGNNINSNNNNSSQNAHLINYTLEDYENLSNINMTALIKISTAKINYCCVALPLNDTCPITQEEFTSNDQVTIIKNCGHIFNTRAINNWLHQHQTCPVCRHNILTNSKLISYINPDTNKKLFLYSNEFRFYLALHIESLLTNRDSTHSTSSIDDDANTNTNANNEQNTYEFGLFLR